MNLEEKTVEQNQVEQNQEPQSKSKKGLIWALVAICTIGIAVGLGWFLLRSKKVLACNVAPQVSWQKPKYKKFKTLADAVKAAQKLKKPIFIDLYADWCFPCKKLEKETFSHPSIKKLLKGFLVVKFNIDKPSGKYITRKYYVNRYPTTLVLDQNGREIERIVGFYPPLFFRPAVSGSLTGKGTYQALRKLVKQQPNNIERILRLADRALLRRQLAEARKLYKKVQKIASASQKEYAARALFGLARLQSRVGRYAATLPFLKKLHKQFPNSKVRMDAYRLQLYSHSRLEERASRKVNRARKKKEKEYAKKEHAKHTYRFRTLCRAFRARYRSKTTRFE